MVSSDVYKVGYKLTKHSCTIYKLWDRQKARHHFSD